MKKKLALLVIMALTGLFTHPAYADGLIIPIPPCDRVPCPTPYPVPPMEQLVIRYHHVTVKIEDQVAVTHVDQVFSNPNDWPVEGTYTFPLPKDAAVSNFTLWMDGQPVKGEVLSADQARQKYEEIVRSLRDPALLEYIGRGAVQAHIFPIPPQGERRIELEYSQVLTAENGLVQYTYPLNTEKFSALPLESVSISVQIHSSQTIRAVYSPTHPVSISRADDNHAVVGYEANNVRPDADFALFYSVGESQAFHLLTYRDPTDPADPDGFFMLLMAPSPQTGVKPLPKDLILVLDHSGSMEGEKIDQAKTALRFILAHLNPDDRFNVISFSTGLDSFASSLRPASEATQASSWVDQVSAGGSTDINRALLEAASMASPERPTYLIFLTDGLPTEGVTKSQDILNNFAAAAPAELRLFAFGVGYDVDTFLLDSLAEEHHGSSTYVLPGQALDEVVSGFYDSISTPVLTNLSLDFGSLSVYDLYPNPLPDLFSGSQIVIVGRYHQSGTTDITLRGQVNGSQQEFPYRSQVFTSDSRGGPDVLTELPRLWATRKVGNLLNQIRLKGPDQETIDQIVKLSIRYGIVTPYTSYLVTEPAALGAGAQDQIAGQAYNDLQAAPTLASSGAQAVQKAAGEGALQSAQVAAGVPAESADVLRIMGARTFILADGAWTDTAFDPEKQTTTKVAFLSDDYFALVKDSPDLAGALALGNRVIVVFNGTAYEVVSSGTASTPIVLQATVTPPVVIPSVSTVATATPQARSTPADQNLTPALQPSDDPLNPPVSTESSASLLCLAVFLPASLVVFLVWRKLRR
jgi:Ca-activated chloride channel homolog